MSPIGVRRPRTSSGPDHGRQPDRGIPSRRGSRPNRGRWRFAAPESTDILLRPRPPRPRFALDIPAKTAPRIFLIDAYALIYRAYFAFINRPLTNAAGENTSAPFGFTRFLLDIREQFEPDYLAVVFDAGSSFRDEIYPGVQGDPREDARRPPRESRACARDRGGLQRRGHRVGRLRGRRRDRDPRAQGPGCRARSRHRLRGQGLLPAGSAGGAPDEPRAWRPDGRRGRVGRASRTPTRSSGFRPTGRRLSGARR